MQLCRALALKIKTADVFSKLGNSISGYQMLPPSLVTRTLFLVQHAEHWETPSWERNISEQDIIQHTTITTEKCFFLCLSKTWLGYGIEIDWFWSDKGVNNMN